MNTLPPDYALGLRKDDTFDRYKYVVEKMLTMTGPNYAESPSSLAWSLLQKANIYQENKNLAINK
jgi:hypothetical protein